MNKTLKSVIGWTVMVSIFLALGFFAVTASLRANAEAAKRHDFQVVCEHEGGHAATFNEGETYVCIRNGEVVKL